MPTENEVRKLIEDAGGKVNEVLPVLPDGTGGMTASFPLPKTHWLYQGDRVESYGVFNTPPMPFRMGADEIVVIARFPNMSNPPDPAKSIRLTKREFANKIQEAGRYAVRSATMNGREPDFDPDALVQNLLVGMLGYWTVDGYSSDEWANPPKDNQKGE